jgi:DNA-binding MarR family transcriptional regulator
MSARAQVETLLAGVRRHERAGETQAALACCAAVVDIVETLERTSGVRQRPLTTRQAQVLELIRRGIAASGVAPTHKQLAAATGLKSLASVSEHVVTLEAKGYIRREFHRSQGISLVEPQREVAG